MYRDRNKYCSCKNVSKNQIEAKRMAETIFTLAMKEILDHDLGKE